MAFFAVLMAAAAKTLLKTKIPKAHIGRAICGMLALLINIVTVQHLQIGTAETLFYTMPLFVSLFVIIERAHRLGVGRFCALRFCGHLHGAAAFLRKP